MTANILIEGFLLANPRLSIYRPRQVDVISCLDYCNGFLTGFPFPILASLQFFAPIAASDFPKT